METQIAQNRETSQERLEIVITLLIIVSLLLSYLELTSIYDTSYNLFNQSINSWKLLIPGYNIFYTIAQYVSRGILSTPAYLVLILIYQVISTIFVIELVARYLITYHTIDTRHEIVKIYRYLWIDKYYIDWIAIFPFDTLFLLWFPDSTLYDFTIFLRFLRILRFRTIISNKYIQWVIYQFNQGFEGSIKRQFLNIFFIVSLIILIFFFPLQHKLQYEKLTGWFIFVTLLGTDYIANFFGIDNFAQEISHFELNIAFILILLGLAGNIIFQGIVLAIIIERIKDYVEKIKSGRGNIIETNHFVILGWHNLTLFLINEIDQYAEKNKQNQKIVLLNNESDLDIDLLKSELGKTKLFYRKGKPFDTLHLKKISIADTKGIVLIGNPTSNNLKEREINDVFMIKQVISLVALISKSQSSKPVIILNHHFYNSRNRENVKEIFRKYHYVEDQNYIQINNIEYQSFYISMLIEDMRYDQILRELLTFEGSEFYILPAKGILFGK